MNKHYQPEPDFEQFILALPKAQRHLHLEGCVTLSQLQGFDAQRYPAPPPFWDAAFRYNGFDHFQAQFDEWIVPYHNSVERYQETARHVFADCQRLGCRYVETSFHLPAIEWMGTDGPTLLAAIKEAAPRDLKVQVFGGMVHDDYGRHQALLESALKWDDLAGIDLHGPETLPVDTAFPDYWRRARDRGKVTKAHAGEFMPADFVGWVVDQMGVTRVQHGVRAIEKNEVVQKLVERDIALDVCPISNLKLGVEGIPTMDAHPVRQLYDAGVTLTINTDDTFMFGNTLIEEYCALSQELGFSRQEIVEIARNGFQDALMDDADLEHIERDLQAAAQAQT